MITPIPRALLLASLTVAGLVGLLVASGAGDWLMTILASAPLVLGALAYVRRRD